MSIDSQYYTHSSDRAALKALKAIPGFHQLMKTFMKVWNERMYRIMNMSSRVRISDNQLKEYYDMLPPVCEKLGIEIPELYLEIDPYPNSYTYGDSKPFIVITSGLLETIPEELLPTVIAHECGHIACHHVLYTTIGSLLLYHSVSVLRSFVPFGNVASLPLSVAFFYWMRCSEYSADRAAVICDGTAEKMSEVCMRLAGFDKDINGIANKEEFMKQGQEYRDMIKNSKWDKTLEFLVLKDTTHPFSAVRALECEEWLQSDQYRSILDGSYLLNPCIEEPDETDTDSSDEYATEGKKDKKHKGKIGLPKIPSIKKKHKDEEDDGINSVSVPDEIRKYKELMDDGIITEEEFLMKKEQLLNL